jgi:hypothetical protein
MVPSWGSRPATWWRRLACLLPAAAMTMFTLAAKAADSSDPKTWNPNTWDIGHLLSDGFSEMRFVVARSNAAGCEPNCPEWISAEGEIEAGTPAKLKRILKKIGARKLPIVVNSPGGNVDAAVQLGRIIRKNKLDIAVGKTSFSQCRSGDGGCSADEAKGVAQLGMASDGGAMCNSACPLMFAGGAQRLVGRWAYLGVHQITTTFQRQQVYYRTMYRVVHGRKKIISSKVISRKNVGTFKTYEMSKAVERRLSAYFREMGVGRGVLDVMKATPAGDIHQIALDDMAATNLVTGKGAVDILIWAGICRRSPAPANCREIAADAKLAKANVAAVKSDPSQPTNEPVSQPAKASSTKPFWAAPGNGAPEMRFVVVRGNDALCNPDCPEWISAEGAITTQTPQRLRQLLARIGNRRLPIVVSSRGGDLFSALIVRRFIREQRLDVAVARTNITGCDPVVGACLAENGAYIGLISNFGVECDSACVLMLAGGVKRIVSPQARLSLYLMGQKQPVRAYLNEMQIDPALFAALERRSVERQLEPKTMLELGLTTSPQSADALTGATICRSVPKPDNCRVRPSANAEPATIRKL